MAPSDLSLQRRDTYRRHLERLGWPEAAAEVERLLTAVWEDLGEAERYGADPWRVVHVLVATKFFRQTRPAVQSETLRTLTRQKRAALVGGIRAFRALGEAGLMDALGPGHQEWARSVYRGIEYLSQRLTEVTVESPAFLRWTRFPPTNREAERLRTACIVCLMRELKDHPKPAAATAVLLEKWGVVRPDRRASATVDFVKKRAQRARAAVADGHGSLGILVDSLTRSFDPVRQVLLGPHPSRRETGALPRGGRRSRVEADRRPAGPPCA